MKKCDSCILRPLLFNNVGAPDFSNLYDISFQTFPYLYFTILSHDYLEII